MDNAVKENLKKLMREKGVNENELASHTGINQSTINRILGGQIKESKPSTLRPIAAYFGISMSQMQGEEPIPNKKSSSSGNVSKLMNHLANHAKLFPLITWEEAAIWNKIFTNYKHNVNKGYVTTNQNVGSRAYGLKINGNSMSSTRGLSFEEGCEILVDPDRTPHHNDYVIAKKFETKNIVIRQLKIEGKSYNLYPLNSRYAVIRIESLKDIFGVVCQITTRL